MAGTDVPSTAEIVIGIDAVAMVLILHLLVYVDVRAARSRGQRIYGQGACTMTSVGCF